MSGLDGLSLDQLRTAANNAQRQAQNLDRMNTAFQTASQHFYDVATGVNSARNAGMSGWNGQAADAADTAMYSVFNTSAESQTAAINSSSAAQALSIEAQVTQAEVASIPTVDTSWSGSFSRHKFNPIAAVSDHQARVAQANQNREAAARAVNDLNNYGNQTSPSLSGNDWPTVSDPGSISKPPGSLPAAPASSGGGGGYGYGGGSTGTGPSASAEPYPVFGGPTGGRGNLSQTEPGGTRRGVTPVDPGGSPGGTKIESPGDPHGPSGGGRGTTPVEPGPGGPGGGGVTPVGPGGSGGPTPVGPGGRGPGNPTTPTGFDPNPQPTPAPPRSGPVGVEPAPTPTPEPFPIAPITPGGPGGPGGTRIGTPPEGEGGLRPGAPEGEGGLRGGAGEGEFGRGGLRGGLGEGEYGRGGPGSSTLDESRLGSRGVLGDPYEERLGGGLRAGAGGVAAEEAAGSREGMFNRGLGRGGRGDDEEEYAVPDYLQETSSVWGGDQLAAPSVIGE